MPNLTTSTTENFNEAVRIAKRAIAGKGDVYKDFIVNAAPGTIYALTPSNGETLRGIKMNITRAANTLQIKLAAPPAEGKDKNGNPAVLFALYSSDKQGRKGHKGADA